MSHETLNLSKHQGMTSSIPELLANIKKLDEQANLGKIPVPIVPNLVDSSDSDSDSSDSSDSDSSDSDSDTPNSPYYPYIYYRWWQRHVSDPELTVHIGDNYLELHDDGSHKWRYMTNVRDDDDESEFILRPQNEMAEMRLLRCKSGKGLLRLKTATVAVSYKLTEEDRMALAASVKELMMRHADGLSAPQERLVTDIAEVFPRSYMVTEQIYSSPFLRSDKDEDYVWRLKSQSGCDESDSEDESDSLGVLGSD